MEIIIGEQSYTKPVGKERFQRAHSWTGDLAESRDQITPELHLPDEEIKASASTTQVSANKQSCNGSKNSGSHSPSPREIIQKLKSQGSSPRTNPRVASIRFKNDTGSLNSSPRGSPRSGTLTPTMGKSSSSSPRKTLNQVVSKLKKTDEIDLENSDNREKQMMKDKKRFEHDSHDNNKKLGNCHYEISYYATTGEIEKLKEILSNSNNYTVDDLTASITLAEKCGQINAASLLKSYLDFF